MTTQARKQKIREGIKKQRRRRVVTSTAVVAVVMVAIVVGIILLTRSSPFVAQPISPTMSGYLAGVSNATLTAAVNAQGVTPLQQVAAGSLTSNGKPEVLYIGAEYCPYCAAERWSIIVALSKFGNFTGLEYMLSSSNDVFANTPTFSFVNAHYYSNYVSFVSVEAQDRNKNNLQTVSNDQQALLVNWGGGGYPFIDIGGAYMIHASASSPNVHSGSQYDPGTLSGLNWTQIGAQLDNSASVIAQRVDGAADTIISAICKIDNGQPANICSQSYAQISITQAPIGVDQPAATNLLVTIGSMLEADRPWKG